MAAHVSILYPPAEPELEPIVVAELDPEPDVIVIETYSPEPEVYSKALDVAEPEKSVEPVQSEKSI